jgi:transcriptional repressor NrdR
MSMDCPHCNAATKVLESRRAEDGTALRRRRECSGCGGRFTTYERFQRPRLHVRKRSGRRQPFDRTKLRAALLKATHKRPVSPADVEALVERIELAIETAGGELDAERLVRLCLAGLGDLDRGAYLQFAGTVPEEIADFAEVGAGGSVRAARDPAQLPPQAPTRRVFDE